ncbi:MAG: DUF960 family protein [Clostridium sp.]
MFSRSNRYVTRGVNEEVDIRLQFIIWSMIDKVMGEGNVELDYLQVFKIRKEGNKVVELCNGKGYDKETLVYIELEEGKYVVKLIPVLDTYSYIYTYKR